MSVDMFIKIDGVKGESYGHDHEEEIDVLSWSWGMSQSGTTHTGGGGGSGKVQVQDINFVKYVDKSTPVLMLFCSNGKHVKEATLFVRKAGEKSIEYIKIKMEDILISSVMTGGSGGEDRLTEQVSLNFAKVTFDYIEQKADGSEGDKPSYKWDIKANVKG